MKAKYVECSCSVFSHFFYQAVNQCPHFLNLQSQRDQFLKQQALEEAQQALDEVISSNVFDFSSTESCFHVIFFFLIYCSGTGAFRTKLPSSE